MGRSQTFLLDVEEIRACLLAGEPQTGQVFGNLTLVTLALTIGLSKNVRCLDVRSNNLGSHELRDILI
ncbi:MAG: hypothetical protein ACXAAO_06380 [Candidatus Thorarchaeota archaeon]